MLNFTNIPEAVVVTSNTDAVTGHFSVIQCLTATTFAALTESNKTGQAMTGTAFQAGTILFGDFTGYTLTSGMVRAYK